MKVTQQQFDKMSKKASKSTNSVKNLVGAFLIGGAICTIGQALLNFYLSVGMRQDQASTLTSVTLIFLSALLTGLNVYDNIARYGGAGTLVPITGFSNAIVSPALEFKSEGYVLGLGAKMFVIAGPVLVYGITASVLYGIIYYIIHSVVK